MEKACGSLAWYQAARQVLDAVLELRELGRTWQPSGQAIGAVFVDADEALPSLKDLAVRVKTKQGKKNTTHLVIDPVAAAKAEAKWRQQFAEVDRLLARLGCLARRGVDGRVIVSGSGLLGAADDAFAKVEPELRQAQLDAALGRVEIEQNGSHPYAQPILVAVAQATASWLQRVANHWLLNPPNQPHTIASKATLADAVAACPVSQQLIGKLAARISLEREWLASRKKPKAGENKGGGKRGGNNKDSNARKRAIEALAAYHRYDPDGRTLRDRITNLVPIKGKELAELAGVCGGTITNVMVDLFGGQAGYEQMILCPSGNGLKRFDEMCKEFSSKTKRQRVATDGQLAFQSKTVAPVQLTQEEAFALARQHADENGFDISDEELRKRLRQAMQVS